MTPEPFEKSHQNPFLPCRRAMRKDNFTSSALGGTSVRLVKFYAVTQGHRGHVQPGFYNVHFTSMERWILQG